MLFVPWFVCFSVSLRREEGDPVGEGKKRKGREREEK